MKLNLGCGREELNLPGYENWDRKNGHEVYPLDVLDGSIWEIRASHVLEHFSHRQIESVVKNWVEKLAPGGCLKVAVPNFQTLAHEYLSDTAENPVGYIMGGHDDEDDIHGDIFDRGKLFDLMRRNGLERIGPWVSEIKDCASHRYSLNLQGFKPGGPAESIPAGEVRLVLAAPRFGPVAHFEHLLRATWMAQLQGEISQGCFWHQNMCEGIERALEFDACKYVVTLDYDTIFRAADVLELYRLMEGMLDADAITSVQSKRHSDCALFTRPGLDGKAKDLTAQEFERPLTRIYSGHFGLTIFRADVLRTFPRPWMLPEPNAEGRWGDGHLDADMAFWHKWNQHGLKLFLGNRVVVGHMSEMIEWPGPAPEFKTTYQPLRDYEKSGIPAAVVR